MVTSTECARTSIAAGALRGGRFGESRRGQGAAGGCVAHMGRRTTSRLASDDDPRPHITNAKSSAREPGASPETIAFPLPFPHAHAHAHTHRLNQSPRTRSCHVRISVLFLCPSRLTLFLSLPLPLKQTTTGPNPTIPTSPAAARPTPVPPHPAKAARARQPPSRPRSMTPSPLCATTLPRSSSGKSASTRCRTRLVRALAIS
jgi:hypothetical protein